MLRQALAPCNRPGYQVSLVARALKGNTLGKLLLERLAAHAVWPPLGRNCDRGAAASGLLRLQKHWGFATRIASVPGDRQWQDAHRGRGHQPPCCGGRARRWGRGGRRPGQEPRSPCIWCWGQRWRGTYVCVSGADKPAGGAGAHVRVRRRLCPHTHFASVVFWCLYCACNIVDCY